MSVGLSSGSHRLVLQLGKYYAPYRGGMESHLETLCGELKRHVDVRVLVANDRPHESHEVADGVPVTRLATVARLAGAPICPKMARMIRESEADLLHIHMPNPGAAIAYLLSGFRGPVVLTWHSDIIRQRVLGNLFAPIQRRLVERARAIIASSPDYVAFSPILYEHRNRCRIIPFGIRLDCRHQTETHAAKQILREYGDRVLLSVGRLVTYKGYLYLIRAMKEVSGTLLLIGDGPERSRLESEVRANGLGERVIFLGKVDDTAPYYQACALFVLPSIARNEAFGIVQLEAMAFSKPVINTQLMSGVPFVSVNGVTGATVPPADASALARAINVLLDDPARRAAYGAAARTRVEREFSLEHMVSETVSLYEQLISTEVRRGAEASVRLVTRAPIGLSGAPGI